MEWPTRQRPRFLAAIVPAMALFSPGPEFAVRAETFAVNSPADVVDAAPGDGVCATAAMDCTLRAAVHEANASTDADTIVLPPGLYALGLRSELTIETDVTLI